MNVFKLPKEQKDELTSRVQTFFIDERSEELGSIAAQSILEFMLKELGPIIYNQAMDDARRLVKEKMESMENDLYAMEKSVSKQRR